MNKSSNHVSQSFEYVVTNPGWELLESGGDESLITSIEPAPSSALPLLEIIADDISLATTSAASSRTSSTPSYRLDAAHSPKCMHDADELKSDRSTERSDVPKAVSSDVFGKALTDQKPAMVTAADLNETTCADELNKTTEDHSMGKRFADNAKVEQNMTMNLLLPAWEVDHFRWPAVANRLVQDKNISFDGVLDLLHPGIRGEVAVITGTKRGEGRTTVSVCLARCAAERGLRTLLVDADLIDGELAQKAGLEFEIGWRGAALNRETLEECLVRCLSTELALMPLGRSGDADDAPSCYAELWKAMEILREQFDVIVVDAGTAAGLVPHLPGQPSFISLALLVQDVKFRRAPEVMDAYRDLRRAGIRSIAIAENFGQRKAG